VSTFAPDTLIAVLPELMLLLLGVVVLVLDPFWKETNRRLNLGWLTAAGLFATLIVSLLIGRPGEPTLALGGMVRFDLLGFTFKMFFIFAAAVTALLFMDTEHLGRRAEAYLLLLAATIGMNLMAAAADLVMLYLAIETTSIPLYVLAGFMTNDDKSNEAGFKYFLFGTLTSTIMLYGFSLVYGFSGTANLAEIGAGLGELNLLTVSFLFLVLVGLAFKVSLFPFHFWAPDVYEGAPTPVAGFLSTASKAAGFAVILRLLITAMPSLSDSWIWIIAILATLTMTVGNLIAMAQKNIKRMLAYSSIAHAGYALIGLVAYGKFGVATVVFYIMAYLLTNLAAFGVIAAVGRISGSEEFPAFYGLNRRNSTLSLVMLVAFLSLAGMPPFGGFVAKVFVFAAAIEAGWIWLAVVGVLNSIFGLYYYLTALKYIYLYRMEGEAEEQNPVPLTPAYSMALLVLTVGIVVMGVAFAPWFDLASSAVLNLF